MIMSNLKVHVHNVNELLSPKGEGDTISLKVSDSENGDSEIKTILCEFESSNHHQKDGVVTLKPIESPEWWSRPRPPRVRVNTNEEYATIEESLFTHVFKYEPASVLA
jgi:hypothetical protein cdiviTM7_01599